MQLVAAGGEIKVLHVDADGSVASILRVTPDSHT